METVQQRWPELNELALSIASEAFKKINELTPKIKVEGMHYKKQFVLEMLISELEKCV